jgi:hypothetical protein
VSVPRLHLPKVPLPNRERGEVFFQERDAEDQEERELEEEEKEAQAAEVVVLNQDQENDDPLERDLPLVVSKTF